MGQGLPDIMYEILTEGTGYHDRIPKAAKTALPAMV